MVMASAKKRSMRRLAMLWLLVMAIIQCSVAADEETPPPPITEFPPSAGSGNENLPATVAPGGVSDSKSNSSSASSSSQENTLAPKTVEFALVHSPSSNEAVDLLEIVQQDVLDSPRISFESMTDRNNWGVDKWENPLTLLSNMIANERIQVTNENVRLNVKLNDAAVPTTVKFTKEGSWQFGPTLVLKDEALSGLSKLVILEFVNFNVSFEGAKWMSPSFSLNKLTFNQTVVNSFMVPQDAEIADILIRESTLDTFPTQLLTLKTLPTSLVIESTTFVKPLELTAEEVENLQTIANVALAQNSFPELKTADCSSVIDVYSQKICVKAASVSTDTPLAPAATDTPADTPTETKTPSITQPNDEQIGTIPYIDEIPDGSTENDTSSSNGASSSNLTNIIMSVVGVMAAVVVVAGLIWLRRRKAEDDLDDASPLTFTNHHDKFLDDPEAQACAHNGSDMSARTTATVAAGGMLSEVNLGARVITAESKMGVNGLWKAEYRGESVAALRVDMEKLRERHQDIEPIVKCCVALKHPYIIEFMGTSMSLTDEMWLVVELMSSGSLRSLLETPALELSWDQIKKMSQRIASALAFVQSTRSASDQVVPLLTSKSILCDQRMNCKLDMLDFIQGTRDYIAPNLSFGQGEIAYRAPELLAHASSPLVSAAAAATAEVYALGVILCELSLQSLVFTDILHDRGATMGEIFIARQVRAGKLCPTPAEDAPEEFASVISACLAFDPTKRPTPTQVVEWLREC